MLELENDDENKTPDLNEIYFSEDTYLKLNPQIYLNKMNYENTSTLKDNDLIKEKKKPNNKENIFDRITYNKTTSKEEENDLYKNFGEKEEDFNNIQKPVIESQIE